ncbi:hypothetical protein EPUL_003385, partial [Erysiphe pulchra]
MPAKKVGVCTIQKPIRLPPLNRLNVKGASARDKNPCLSIMSSVLSNKYCISITLGCQNLETQLRSCMDTPKSKEEYSKLSFGPDAAKC